ncbi:23S rRNA (adenine(2030)-N(6))-methyltransferase RlmJ [Reinekea marinisedimentorum]|uniref:Ribosomal RNA large subunit methyltransferase J n=1 Tax=Reinekea marinisedimentorum TaxID=230495 RepID=A0A4R3IAZ2_9GAMM|nr:23S rRNA (adenine(2030)-N(6))-methyltransferase RlmJ [Reinekea marinisedimentorum]TCS43750.1 23S rRNA (adenine2030-N6)-methyltransferase [Reinekea marinisedimentorum]
MLSYQHHYHAGNHADVLKHWVLLESLRHLQKKPAPFDYIDTHAGAGMYQLKAAEAQKTGEYEQGMGRVIHSSLAELQPLLDLIRPQVDRGRYPGSPAIVNSLLRDGDHAHLFELHPQTHRELEQSCARKRQTYVRKEDGFIGLKALLPVKSHRALVLIDPSYELKEDYQKVFQVTEAAWQKMHQATILIWYPVVDRARINRFEKQFVASRLKNVHLFEMSVADDQAAGMTGSGIVAVNPPWTLAERFNSLMPELSRQLSSDGQERFRHRQLRAE